MGSSLTDFEQLILLALIRLDDSAYGVAVHREITLRTGREVLIGSVYSTLARLEEKGLITSHLGEPTAERGGRRKKFFRIHAYGRRAVLESLKAIQTMVKGLDPKLRPI